MMTTSIAEQAGTIAHDVAMSTEKALQASHHAALDALSRVRATSRQLRNSTLDARDGALRYVRHEPTKSVLIAAAVGAVVVGLVALLGSRRQSD